MGILYKKEFLVHEFEELTSEKFSVYRVRNKALKCGLIIIGIHNENST